MGWAWVGVRVVVAVVVVVVVAVVVASSCFWSRSHCGCSGGWCTLLRYGRWANRARESNSSGRC